MSLRSRVEIKVKQTPVGFVWLLCFSFIFTEAIAKRLCRLSERVTFGLAECSIGAVSGCG